MDYNRKFQDGLVLQGEPAEVVAEYFLRASEMYGSYEVKNDLQAWDTGRVYIEKSSRGALSGLSTTKSEWWIIVITEVADKNYDSYIFNQEDVRGILVFRTETLRKFIADNRPAVVAGGDSNTSEGWLIPIGLLPMYKDSLLPPRMHCPPECSCRL